MSRLTYPILPRSHATHRLNVSTSLRVYKSTLPALPIQTPPNYQALVAVAFDLAVEGRLTLSCVFGRAGSL